MLFSVYTYILDVYTGDKPHAGTYAIVYVVLYGERGDTGKRKLLKSNNKDRFQESQVCIQTLYFVLSVRQIIW